MTITFCISDVLLFVASLCVFIVTCVNVLTTHDTVYLCLTELKGCLLIYLFCYFAELRM